MSGYRARSDSFFENDIYFIIKKDFFEGEDIKFYKENKFYLNIKNICGFFQSDTILIM